MLRFVKIKVAKEEFCGPKTPLKNWNVNVDNIVTSNLVESSNNSK